jgi:hypothetical protein
MSLMYYFNSLERIVTRVRDTLLREPGEGIDAYMRRSWQIALEEYEALLPELDHVREARERSERLLENERQKGIDELK